METISAFVKENYIVFTVVSLVLVLALIGYLVDARLNKDIKIRKKTPTDVLDEEIDSI